MVQAQDALEFNNIYEEVHGVMQSGKLKCIDHTIIFKNFKTGKSENILSQDILSMSWLRMASGMGIKLTTSNDKVFRFGGFSENEFDKLSQFFKDRYGKTLKEQVLSVKGYNWGKANFNGSMLMFDNISNNESSNKTPSLELPLNYISHCTPGKNEIALEFQQNDDAPISLMEMRFYIASSDNDADPVKTFHDNIIAKANVIQAVGDAISTFYEAHCLTPRGRYDIKLYPTFAQLHGKTFDYKIPYATILRLFMLPHKDNRHIFSVISLDPPIKQGQTRYPYLILLFDKDEDINMNLTLSEEELHQKYGGKLTKTMEGKTFEIFGRLVKSLSGNKITLPGNFTSHSGGSCISCSYKAAAGYLYPLDRGFIYVHKPPIHIRFDEIGAVNFARSTGTTTRTFDFEIETKTGINHTFSNIVKEEYTALFDFIKEKNLLVRNIGSKLDSKTVKNSSTISDEDEGDDTDPYLSRVKAEGMQREDDDDDEEEEDEDYAPDGGKDDNDVAEEYESNVSSSESEKEAHDDERKNKADKQQADKVDEVISSSLTSLSESEEIEHANSLKSKKAKTTSTVKAGMKGEKNKKDKSENPRKNKKARKDPNMPKRPLSAFFIWLQENRERIKKDNNASVVEITKIAGEEWKKIKDKGRWENMALKAKDAYSEAMKSYKLNQNVH